MTQVSYEDESSRCQQDIALLKEDLELTRNDLAEAEATATQYKTKMERLDETLRAEQQAHTASEGQVAARLKSDKKLSDCQLKFRLILTSPDLPTVPLSPYLLRFSGS